ncbi:kinase [Staphylococcus cohnii]|uniref:AAA family ATPase n=1 Tax=Staphylococcus cohnii TaxID=29382 RepID=UPI001CCE403D|nr:AAA family ATPase [Staphylococcus cohnii]MBZ8173430.1 kinase [Staphylococcus cohnii]
MTKLILLRGNSGSGKTTIAHKLQNTLGNGVMLVGQDEIRRHMLNVSDSPGNLSIELIKHITAYGIAYCEYVILEGIFNKEKYGNMLQSIISNTHIKSYLYYFDLPYEETVRRHHSKVYTDFSAEKLASWFVEKDTLNVKNEKLIPETMTQNDILTMILNDLNNE